MQVNSLKRFVAHLILIWLVGWPGGVSLSAGSFTPQDSGVWAGVLHVENESMRHSYAMVVKLDGGAAVGEVFAEYRFFTMFDLEPVHKVVLRESTSETLLGVQVEGGKYLEFQIDDNGTLHEAFDGRMYSVPRVLRVSSVVGPGADDWDVAYSAVLYQHDGSFDSPPSVSVAAERDNHRRRALNSEAFHKGRVEAREEQIAEGWWYRDVDTGCEALLPSATVSRFVAGYFHNVVHTIHWSGECIDGKAEGSGILSWIDLPGRTFWEEDYSGLNGMLMVGGVPTVVLDGALVRLWLTSCEPGDALNIRIRASYEGAIDPSYPIVARYLAEHALATLIGQCIDLYPEQDTFTARVNFPAGKGHPVDDSRRADWDGFALRFHGARQEDGKFSYDFSNPWVDYHTLWPTVVRNRIDEAISVFERTRAEHSASQQVELPPSTTDNRTLSTIRARDALERDYFSLAAHFDSKMNNLGEIMLRIHVGVRVPAQFPNPEFTASAAIDCNGGGWFADGQKAVDDFKLFLEISGATMGNRSFNLDDVEVSCTEDLLFTVKTPSLEHTLALLDYGRHWRRSFRPTVNRHSQYVSLALRPMGGLYTNNPAVDGDTEGLCCVKGIRISEDDWLTSFGATVVGLDAGDGLQQVVFQGRETPQRLTARGVNHIYVNLEGGSQWDYLTIDLGTGTLTWQRTTTPPR